MFRKTTALVLLLSSRCFGQVFIGTRQPVTNNFLPIPESPSPTDSPVPSPSPTATPTGSPTGTHAPSPSPSRRPTDSPVPSPSPTHMPSRSPSASPTSSPSQTPTGMPSSSPTAIPTASPSSKPTTTPSSSPSLEPTMSAKPSVSPSSAPSVSPTDYPSVAPTNAPTTTFSPSTTPSVSPAPSFMPSHKPSLNPTPHPTDMPSMFPSFSPSTSRPSLAFVVKSALLEVTLNLHDNLGPMLQGIFVDKTAQFLQTKLDGGTPPTGGVSIDIMSLTLYDQTMIPARRRLHDAGLRLRFNVTAEIRPQPPPGFNFATEVGRPLDENFDEYKDELSAAHPVFNELVRDASANANALEDSPTSSDSRRLAPGLFVTIIVCAVAAAGLAIFFAVYAMRRRKSPSSVASPAKIDLYALEQADSHSTDMTPYGADKTSPNYMASPFVMEAGRATPDKSLLDAIKVDSESEDDEPGDLGLKLSANVLAAHASTEKNKKAKGNNNHRLGAADPPAGHRVQIPPNGLYSSDDDISPKSIELTPSSVCSATSKSFGITLGARPMNECEQSHYNGDQSVSDGIKRSGLYDVFAPAGPLGIVVDTTKNGPIVHSMKPTSSLLGLVSPGDLIVGLDDIDTRGMTAATLTRLMAKRSNQPERKITLLAVDNGN